MRIFRGKWSKLDGKEPKPPTKADILEDLQTFNVDHLRVEKTHRRLDDTALSQLKKTDISIASVESTATTTKTNESTDEERQLEEWWESFEKFLSDIDKLEMYQQHFEAKKTNLIKLDDTIAIMADDIQTRISNSLQKALEEVVENENDLK